MLYCLTEAKYSDAKMALDSGARVCVCMWKETVGGCVKHGVVLRIHNVAVYQHTLSEEFECKQCTLYV